MRYQKPDRAKDTQAAEDILKGDLDWLQQQAEQQSAQTAQTASDQDDPPPARKRGKKPGSKEQALAASAAAPDPVVEVEPNADSALAIRSPSETVRQAKNSLQQSRPSPAQHYAPDILANETPLWTMYWELPEIRSIDTVGDELVAFTYKDFSCRINQYENDEYTTDALQTTARRMFECLHLLMDAIRRHMDMVEPNSHQNFLEIMDQETLNIIQSYRRFVLNKRIGYPRITVEPRYGFIVPGTSIRLKLVLYEHTDPVDIFLGAMEQLSMALTIELANAEVEKQYFQMKGIDEKQARREPSNPGRRRVEPSVVTGQINCAGDEDAQEAPFDTLLIYHATRIFHGDTGKWNFYMPKREVFAAARQGKDSFDNTRDSKGIYAYPSGGPNQEIIERALREGLLPDLPTGESTRWLVDLAVEKKQTKNGNATYIIRDINKIPDPNDSK